MRSTVARGLPYLQEVSIALFFSERDLAAEQLKDCRLAYAALMERYTSLLAVVAPDIEPVLIEFKGQADEDGRFSVPIQPSPGLEAEP